MKKKHTIDSFVKIVGNLRKKCPWDKKQTHRSLKKYLIEEAFETAEAIENRDLIALREELGDLLLQVVLHAQLAAEKKQFNFYDVVQSISEKMIRRHPHVFGKDKASLKHQKKWLELKAKENPNRSLFGGVPKAMPALSLAQRYGQIASSIGFDWSTKKGVFEKIVEETEELKIEIRKGNKNKIEEELGDLLLSITSLCRHANLDAETAMKKSAEKFRSRMEKMEKLKKKEGGNLLNCTKNELESLWSAVKKK